jgi:hypothetical protein
MKMKKTNKHTILLGEGVHQHTLYGDFSIDIEAKQFSSLVVNSDSELKHETPGGQFAEHNTLKIGKGDWVMGRQVEYNPFKREVSQVWD